MLVLHWFFRWIWETKFNKEWNCHPVTSGNRALYHLFEFWLSLAPKIWKSITAGKALLVQWSKVSFHLLALETRTTISSFVTNGMVPGISNAAESVWKGLVSFLCSDEAMENNHSNSNEIYLRAKSCSCVTSLILFPILLEPYIRQKSPAPSYGIEIDLGLHSYLPLSYYAVSCFFTWSKTTLRRSLAQVFLYTEVWQ